MFQLFNSGSFKKVFSALLVLFFLLGFGGNVWGQTTRYWKGSGTWTSANQWALTSGGTYNTTWVSNDIAVFDVASSSVTFASTGITGITANQNVTFTAAGTLTTNGTQIPITVASGMNLNLAGQPISTAAGTGIIKNGSGILTLSNANSYTGGFVLNSGMVAIGGVNALGNGGALTINGGTIAGTGNRDLTGKYSGGIIIGGDFTLGSSTSPASSTATLIFTNNTALGSSVTRTITLGGTGLITWNGIISGINSNLVINSSVAGTLSLGGANTYTGSTTISGGTLALSGSGSIASSSGISIASGATFSVSGTTSGTALGATQNITVSSTGSNTTSTITVASSQNLTLGSSGGLTFTAYGGGATAPLTITGASAGALALNSAPITVTTTSALAAGSYTLIAKAGTATGVSGTPGALTVNGSGLAAGTAGTLSVVSGQLILTVAVPTTFYSNSSIANTAAQTTSNWSSNTNGTGFNPTNFTTAGQTFIVQNGHQYQTSSSWTGSGTSIIQVQSGGALDINAQSLSTWQRIDISGTGVSSSGALLNSSSSSASLSVPVTLTAAATITSSGAGGLTLTGNVVNGGFLLTVDGANSTVISTGVISGSGGITKAGNGTLTLSGANTYTGLTTVSQGILKLGATGTSPNGPLGTTGAGTTVSANGALDLAGFTLGTAEALTLNGTGVSSGGALMNSGSAATYSGLITLGSASSIIGGTGTITISNVGTITGAGLGLTLGGAQGGTLTSILGTTNGTLLKQDAGTWTLLGNNTYTGATTISQGTLKLGVTGTSPNGPLGTTASGTTINSGAVLDLNGLNLATTEPLTINGTGISSNGALTNSSATGATWQGSILLNDPTNNSVGTTGGTLTISGIIDDGVNSYNISIGGSGTTWFSATNTYGGSTTINSGATLYDNKSPGTAIPDGSALVVNGTFDLNGNTETVGSLSGNGNINASGASSVSLTCGQDNSNTTYGGVYSDASNLARLIKTGSGTLTITGANTFNNNNSLTSSVTADATNSDIVITAGTIELGTAANRFVTTNVVCLNGGTFSTGVITGYGQTFGRLSLTDNSIINLGVGSHTLTFAASNSFATWTTGKTLTINGWVGTGGNSGSGTAGRIFIGNSASLSAAQLAQITITGYGAVMQTSAGEIVPKVQYRSIATGNWGTSTTWEVSTNGGSTWSAAASGPSSADGSILVQNGHNVTVAIGVTVDEVTIATGGTLTVAASQILTISNGAGDDITINGILVVNGTVSNSGAIQVNSGGYYNHANGSSLPTGIAFGTNGSAGTLEVSGSATCSNLLSLSGASELYDIVWTSSGALPGGFSSGSYQASNGEFTINNSAASWQIYSSGSGSTGKVTVGGNFNLISGTINLNNGNGSISGGANSGLDVVGDYIQSGGTLNILNTGSGSYTGALYVQGNFTHTAGTFSSSGAGNVYLNGTTGIQNIESTGQTGNVNFDVASSNAQCRVATGKTFVYSSSTSFNIGAGTSNPDLQIDGTFNRLSSSAITGSGITINVASGGTYISNYATASIPTATWDANSTLQIDASIADGEFTESFGNVIFNNNAGCTMYTSASTFTQTIQGNLTINSTGSVFLHSFGTQAATLTINGNFGMSANGIFDLDNVSSSSSLTRKMVVNGNVSISNGTLRLSSNSSSAVTTSTHYALLDVYGNFSHTAGTISETAVDVDLITRINFLGTTSKTFETSGQTGTIEIILNKTGSAGNNLMTLSSTSTISNILTLTSGKIITNGFGFTLNNSTSGSTSSYIVADATGTVTMNAVSAAKTIPVGTSSSYAPIILSAGSSTNYSTYVTTTLPCTATDATKVVNLAWGINGTNTPSSVTFQWNSGDQAASFVPASTCEIARYSSSCPWSTALLAAASGSNPYTISTNTGLSSGSNIYVIGNQGSLSATAALTAVTLSSVLTTTYGTPSTGVSFTASGSNLTSNITVTAQSGYEVSTTLSSGYTSSVSVVSGTTVYVRFTATKAAGDYNNAIAVVLSGGGASSNANVTTSSSGNTVSPKAVTITGMTANNKVYDATTSATLSGTAAYSGLVNGESFSVTGTPSASFATKTVGTAKSVTVSGYTAPSANYTLSQPSLTADITVATLTITGATASNKTYDGATTATITGGSLSGVLGSDFVSLSLSGTFASASAANGISVTSTSSLSGTDSGNYTLTQPSGLSANITSQTLTITANNVSKPYNTSLTTPSTGSTSFTSSGLVGSETIGSVTITYTSGYNSTDAVGTYTSVVVPSAATGGTFNASNYTITYTAGNLTINTVTPTITVAPTASPITYGQTLASSTLSGGSASVPGTFAFTNPSTMPNAGTASQNITFTPSDATNYNSVSSTVSVTVNAKALTITANGVSKLQGVALTGGSGSTAFTSSGLVGSETIGSVTIAYGTAGAATGDGNIPGVYTSQVTPSSATGGTFTTSNYSITYIAGIITVLETPATIAAWDLFGESSPSTSTADVSDANLSSTPILTRGSGASSSSASNSFRTTGFQNDGISTSNTDYFQTTISSTTSNISLSTIDAKFGGTSGFYASPGVTSQFAYSLDGTNFTLIGSPQQSTSLTLTQIDLSGISALQNVSAGTTITLRYYASGQTTTGGWGFLSSSAGVYGLKIQGLVKTVPQLSTPTATSITTSSATLGATVTSQGSTAITARGTVYGTSASPTGNSLAEGGTSVSTFSHSRTGLTANTLYYYRGYATNSIGTGYSADGTFTTIHNAPTIGSGSNATTTALNANWTAPSGGNATFTYEVQLSTSSSDFSSPVASQSSIASNTTTYQFTGLSPNTTYYFRVRANNSGGSSDWSSVSLAYTTLNNPTLSATSLSAFGSQCLNTTSSANSFTINGVALTSADVTVSTLSGFTFSTTLGGTYTSSLSLSQSGGTYSQIIYVKFNPNAEQSYNGNIVVGGAGASDINVSVSGSGISGTVALTTTSASSITTTSATSGGSSISTSCGTITAKGVAYGTSANPTTPVTSDGSGIGNFTSSFSGLTPNTVYNYRAYATNDNSVTSYGSNLTFTTIHNAPIVGTGSSIGSTNFTANWSAPSSGGSATFTYEVAVSTSASFASTLSSQTGISSGTTSYQFTGLTAGSTYYFRVRANNAGGSSDWSTISTSITTLIPWENFETGTKAGYAVGDVTCTAGSWNLNNALIATSASDRKFGSQCLRIQSTGVATMNFNVNNGISSLTIYHALYGTDPSATWRLEVSNNGGTSWDAYVSSDITTSSTSLIAQNFNVDLCGTLKFRIVKLTGTRLNIDDIVLVEKAATPSAPSASAQSFCTSSSPTVSSLSATGANIQWYSVATGGSALATNSSLSSGTYYVSQTVSTCESPRTSVSVTVDAASVAGTISGGGVSVCTASNSTALSLSGNTGNVTKWQSSTTSDFSSSVTDIVNTTTSLTATNLTQTTYYRAVVVNGACSSVNSPGVTITINTPSIPFTISGNQYYIWRGQNSTLYSTASNWYYWDGSEYSVASTSPGTTAQIIVPSGTCVSLTNAPEISAVTSSGSVTILDGGKLTISNTFDAYGDVIVKDGGGIVFQSNGVFEIHDGHLTFEGTTSYLTPSTGSLKFHTTTSATHGHKLTCNSSSNTFYNLEFHGDASLSVYDFTLESDINVTNEIKVVTNNVKLNNHRVNLGSTGFITEGTNGKKFFDLGTGYFESTRTIGSGQTINAGNLGLTIQAASGKPLGSTVIKRYHTSISNDLDGLYNAAISRYYNVTPQYNGGTGNTYSDGLGATVTFNYSTATIDPSIDESHLAMYRKGQGESSWEKLDNGTLSMNNKTYTFADFPKFSDVTLGGGGSPLPVDLLSFSGNCEEGKVSLQWKTASEHNSSYFEVEKLRSGDIWSELTKVPAAGNSNQTISYKAIDNNVETDNNYYRLKQVDIDGTEKQYTIIDVSCKPIDKGYFITYPNPSGSSFQLVANDKDLLGKGLLSICDSRGVEVIHREIDIESGVNVFVINEHFAPGIYMIRITNGNKSTDVIRQSIR